MPSRIEDYALIGDCEAAALIARNGSLDWLCWPRFDTDACFAALVNTAFNLTRLEEPEESRRAQPVPEDASATA